MGHTHPYPPPAFAEQRLRQAGRQGRGNHNKFPYSSPFLHASGDGDRPSFVHRPQSCSRPNLPFDGRSILGVRWFDQGNHLILWFHPVILVSVIQKHLQFLTTVRRVSPPFPLPVCKCRNHLSQSHTAAPFHLLSIWFCIRTLRSASFIGGRVDGCLTKWL